MTFQEKLAQFAELAVKVGVNIQKGQTLLINTTTDTIEFTRLVVKEAYAAGAGRVTVNFSDGEIDRAFLIMLLRMNSQNTLVGLVNSVTN